MKLRSDIFKGSGSRAAFTMVEIAIALAIIAFALVAIIGILPTGLQVQRDNREETLVNQDARLLVEAIKSGGRDVASDLGRYVVATNGVDAQYPPPGIDTAGLIRLLTDTEAQNKIVMSSISGAVATRGSELGFRYEILSHVTTNEFTNTVLANQVYEIRMRFAWPVLPSYEPSLEANTYKVRTLVSGTRKNGLLYGQYYWNNIFTNTP